MSKNLLNLDIKYDILMFRSENESVSKENVVTKLE